MVEFKIQLAMHNNNNSSNKRDLKLRWHKVKLKLDAMLSYALARRVSSLQEGLFPLLKHHHWPALAYSSAAVQQQQCVVQDGHGKAAKLFYIEIG